MKRFFIFVLMAIGIFFIDRAIKELFLQGAFLEIKCIRFGYVLNKGVAFSLLSFLGPALKWIILAIVGFFFGYLIKKRWLFEHPILFGTLFGAALGNLYDRFVYGGVIDYVYWHCGFDFAVFNFADVMIDLSVVLLIYLHLKKT
ncbi:signal peptidase II [Nitratiruptor sp. SB155-2]|uniref:signal peptidase II n=1 Tax=Nitratiruptor sp. (strain SB155-2) TaxID=387092 RepID=UPI0001586EDD|nr:signal peptidase II [Nitratiruptor sp. SB155-2]BAF69224.1 lipoprotein signal peptidase II [Nitratiruptor sp. SB155-2]